MDGGAWWAAVHGVAKSWTRLRDFTFTFHFHALEKEMATHSSVLAWRVPGTGEPGGLPSLGSHRVGHDCSGLAAAAAGGCEAEVRRGSTPFWVAEPTSWAARGGKGADLPLGFPQGTSPTHGAPPSSANHLPKAPPPSPSPRQLGSKTRIWGDTSIRPLTPGSLAQGRPSAVSGQWVKPDGHRASPQPLGLHRVVTDNST